MQQNKIRLRPIAASDWFKFNSSYKHLIKSNGGIPTNDWALPLWGNSAKIKLLRGGRGGGKSDAICDVLIDKCLNSSYFKCLYGRKVFETVRSTSFAALVESIKKMNVERYFHFSTANTSSMIITCLLNGNSFIPFGADKISKLKSFKDPTHVWCEEFDQFEERDFTDLYPVLRTTKGENEFWGSFNSYAVYQSHWILKYFYPDLYKGEDNTTPFEIEEGLFFDLSVNYDQNHFIDREAYAKTLKMASGGNQLIFEGLANGAWGVTENKNPWLYAFDHIKHISDTVKFLPQYPVYLSFDFNNDPFTCVAVQMSPHKGAKDSFIHFVQEFSGNFKIEDMCQRIKTKFPQSILHITGDRSGQNEDIGRNQTLYQIIAGYLGVNNKLLNLNNSNLEHADSRIMINAMLNNYPSVKFSREGCSQLIADCQKATTDPDSKKPSQLLKDRGQYKMDLFDGMRYFFQTYFHVWAKDNYLRAVKK